MEKENPKPTKRKIIVNIKHVTAVMIISTALMSTMSHAVYAAISTTNTHNILSGYIYFTYNDKTKNLLAGKNEKRKGYNSSDRFLILSMLTRQTPEDIITRIQHGETVESIAEEYGVLNEYNACVLDAYNNGLDKLYKAGKLSAEEYNSMYNNADLSFINTLDTNPSQNTLIKNNGDIVSLLAAVINKSANEIEELLISGQNPWQIAEQYGKYAELKELVFENTLANIDLMLENGEITSAEADDMIADFESSFLN